MLIFRISIDFINKSCCYITVQRLSMATASAIEADVQIENNDGDNTYVVKDAPIPAKSALETLGGGKMVLEANDIVKVTSSAASSIDVALSIMEITS